jgi:hypothetical protein
MSKINNSGFLDDSGDWALKNENKEKKIAGQSPAYGDIYMNTTVTGASEETRQMEIPAEALTTCPIRGFKLISIANRCIGCKYHQGFIDTTPDDAAFNLKYRVSCGVPQARDIFMVDTGGDE